MKSNVRILMDENLAATVDNGAYMYKHQNSGWKTTFLLKWPLIRGRVNFRGCICKHPQLVGLMKCQIFISGPKTPPCPVFETKSSNCKARCAKKDTYIVGFLFHQQISRKNNSFVMFWVPNP